MSSTRATSKPRPAEKEQGPVESGLDLAMELRRRWEAGDRITAGELLEARPDLAGDPEAALEVAYEEYCQREAAGEAGVELEILSRYPQWAGPLRIMLECHRHLLQAERRPPRFPAHGDCVGEFNLLEEIGSGGRGRVFLAAQAALADRPVILKITPLDGAEHLSLARLQHTNIVPLYSVLDVPEQNIRVLCMPYFGRATLASALGAMGRPVDSRTGAGLVDAIDRMQEASAPRPESGPRQMLEQATYVQAMCWIIACLADALDFAHERGLVHLDLKPSNILLAADGQPMLLDFHLAREPIRANTALPDNLGGTPAYMPPEQHEAMRAQTEGLEVQLEVDARADVYALGAILYESLGGLVPAGPDPPPVERLNRQVSRGLSDVAARCLRRFPQDRYASASALAEDLRRHLADRPLAGVPNRSLSERWKKWRRRRPSALRAAALAAMLAAALLVVLWATMQNFQQRQGQAAMGLSDGQRQAGNGQLAEAVESFGRGARLIEGLPFQGELRSELGRQLEATRRLLLAQQTHELAEQVRRLPGTPDVPAERLRSLSSMCVELWKARGVLTQLDGGPCDAQLESDMKDIAIFAAMLRSRTAGDAAHDRASLAEAIAIIDEVEAEFGPGAVLDYERRRCRLALDLDAGGAKPPPAIGLSAWEHRAMGRSLLDAGDLADAAEQLAAARALEPGGLWENFYYGLCAYRLGEYQEAVTAFSVCIGSRPDLSDCFYNRGLAYAAQGLHEQALHDYRRALALDPDHPARAAIASLPRTTP